MSAEPEMVTRVAKAIRAMPARPGGYVECEAIARAAIEAMRQPTEAMTDAGAIVGEFYDHNASRVWQAMIDAALEKTREPA